MWRICCLFGWHPLMNETEAPSGKPLQIIINDAIKLEEIGNDIVGKYVCLCVCFCAPLRVWRLIWKKREGEIEDMTEKLIKIDEEEKRLRKDKDIKSNETVYSLFSFKIVKSTSSTWLLTKSLNLQKLTNYSIKSEKKPRLISFSVHETFQHRNCSMNEATTMRKIPHSKKLFRS